MRKIEFKLPKEVGSRNHNTQFEDNRGEVVKYGLEANPMSYVRWTQLPLESTN